MQSRQVQTLSTSDTSGAIRGYTNVTDVPAAQKVVFFLQNVGQFDVPPPLLWKSACQVLGGGRRNVWESQGLEHFSMPSS